MVVVGGTVVVVVVRGTVVVVVVRGTVVVVVVRGTVVVVVRGTVVVVAVPPSPALAGSPVGGGGGKRKPNVNGSTNPDVTPEVLGVAVDGEDEVVDEGAEVVVDDRGAEEVVDDCSVVDVLEAEELLKANGWGLLPAEW